MNQGGKGGKGNGGQKKGGNAKTFFPMIPTNRVTRKKKSEDHMNVLNMKRHPQKIVTDKLVIGKILKGPLGRRGVTWTGWFGQGWGGGGCWRLIGGGARIVWGGEKRGKGSGIWGGGKYPRKVKGAKDSMRAPASRLAGVKGLQNR